MKAVCKHMLDVITVLLWSYAVLGPIVGAEPWFTVVYYSLAAIAAEGVASSLDQTR